jgi:putative transcriptional regulator
MATQSPPKSEVGYLAGQFLVAMPGMMDPRFHRAVIYMCAHTAESAMGLVVNKPMQDLKFADILENLNIKPRQPCDAIIVRRGGPVERQRGFVLHSADYQREGTLVLDGEVALSATTEVLKAIADGTGPKQNLMALGYAGWGPGQLDDEIKRNAWLSVPGDSRLLFSGTFTTMWEDALAKLGIAPHMLSSQAGRA